MTALASYAAHTWRLADLLRGLVDASALDGPIGDWQVADLGVDARALAPGALFLACQGRSGHGLALAEEARRRGAAAILAEATDAWPAAAIGALRERLGIPVIPVSRLGARLSAIADRFYGSPSHALRVIGVTGSHGKNSISHYLSQGLSSELSCALMAGVGQGFPGDLHRGGGRDAVTLQATLEDLRVRGAGAVAMPVSREDIERNRLSGVRFSHLVFAGCLPDRTCPQEAEALRPLVDPGALGWVVLNLDDAQSQQVLDRLPPEVSVAAYSLRGDAALPSRCDLLLRAVRLETAPWGLRIQVASQDRHEDAVAELEIGLLGPFNAAGALAVLATMRTLGIPLARAARGLATLRGAPGRMERFGGDRAPWVVVDSARIPADLERVLLGLRQHGYRRIISVLGCNGDRDPSIRAAMGAVAERLSDRLILTDDNPRDVAGETILADMRSGLSDPGRVEVERQRGLAIRLAIALAGIGDLVLVAGKGHETVQDMGDLKAHFSDRAQVVEALREWREGHH